MEAEAAAAPREIWFKHPGGHPIIPNNRWSPRTLSSLLILAAVGAACPGTALAVTSLISSNFNGTAIPAGRTIWFNSVLDYSGPTSSPVTVQVRNGVIRFSNGGVPYALPVPDADITFSPSASQATTAFSSGRWLTTTPFGLSGNNFLAGLGFSAGLDLSGGTNPVTWEADFFSLTPGVSIQWKWAAAVYTSFDSDPSLLA